MSASKVMGFIVKFDYTGKKLKSNVFYMFSLRSLKRE